MSEIQTISKFIAKLPDSKHYRALKSTQSGKYIWEDKGSPLVRVEAPIPQPWNTSWVILRSLPKGKSDAAAYVQRLVLKCFPLEDNPAALTQAIIEREIYKAKFPYSKAPTLFCSAFPYFQNQLERANEWLMYSIYQQSPQ